MAIMAKAAGNGTAKISLLIATTVLSTNNILMALTTVINGIYKKVNNATKNIVEILIFRKPKSQAFIFSLPRKMLMTAGNKITI